MGKLLTAMIALAALGGMAYWAMYGRAPQTVTSGNDPAAATASQRPYEPSAPKRQLDNVRDTAARIEQNDQKYVDEAEAKTQER